VTTETVGAVCLPNISTPERRRRLVAGIVQFAIGLVILPVLVGVGANRWWRLALFPLFAGGAFGYFQWQDRT